MKLVFVVLLLAETALAAPRVYLRGAISAERSRDTIVTDRDCSSTQPPALFGCVEGNDGRALAARGDLGSAPAWQFGAGLELGTRIRVELSLQQRSGVNLDANANFPGVADEQPVRANGRSRAALIIGSIDIAPPTWRVRPFVSAGAGGARNELGEVTYAFPSIAADAVTITRGGTNTSFAWTAAAGASIAINDRLALDLAMHYADLGEMRTADGSATIIRPRGTFVLDIAGTNAPLRTNGVTLGLRYRL